MEYAITAHQWGARESLSRENENAKSVNHRAVTSRGENIILAEHLRTGEKSQSRELNGVHDERAVVDGGFRAPIAR